MIKSYVPSGKQTVSTGAATNAMESSYGVETANATLCPSGIISQVVSVAY